MFYSGLEEFVAGAARFIREGVSGGEDVLVAVNSRKIARLRAALDPDAERVHFVDIEVAGSNPARIIPVWNAFVAARGSETRSVRGIGEPIWAERSPDELVESQHHESLLNVAFADTPSFRLLCPYDVTALPPEVIEESRRSHPLVFGDDGITPSDDFRGVDACARPRTDPLAEPCAPPFQLTFDAETLAEARDKVTSLTAGTLAPSRGEDVRLVVAELLVNSIRHGGGRGTLLAWQDGSTWVFEVRDQGRIADPLVGRRPPRADQVAGFGLWLVNRLCDLVQQRSHDSGNTVRVRIS
jgi:anti-sigma regulatory factor (Ser/Thr protein kinase)